MSAKPWTEPQRLHIERMVAKTGYANLLAAWQELLPDQAAPTTAVLDLPQASALITALDARLKAMRPAEPDAARQSRFLTARHLRNIDTGVSQQPDDVDEHALWVLTRLAKWRAVEALADSRPVATATPPLNGDQPILVEHVLAYFKTWDLLAESFGVTVPTAKAWGTTLPLARSFEAEVKTKGFVRVPSAHRG